VSQGGLVNKASATATQALLAGWTDRAAGMGDIDRAVELMNARSQRFYGEDQITPEDVAGWWKSPRLDLSRDLRLVFDVRGTLAGIAYVGNPGEPYAEISCAGTTHPRHEGHDELWDWLHAWGLDRASEFLSLAPEGIRIAAVSSTVFEDRARRAALERAGFSAVRVANHMRIDLSSAYPAPRWPSGVSVRTVDVEQDIRDIVSLYVEAWRDHWGFIEKPFDQEVADWREGIERDGERFDPTLWFLAVEGPEIVGISLCTSHIAGDATRGYVQGLGVRPAWRKRGIALALLHHSFAEFQRRGYAAVELDMDSENLTGALRVYERAGMRATRQSVFYDKELRAGTDLATRALEA
jgi:mycothiol synthase